MLFNAQHNLWSWLTRDSPHLGKFLASLCCALLFQLYFSPLSRSGSLITQAIIVRPANLGHLSSSKHFWEKNSSTLLINFRLSHTTRITRAQWLQSLSSKNKPEFEHVGPEYPFLQTHSKGGSCSSGSKFSQAVAPFFFAQNEK